jgi:CubicO group peptidase (beta-lactamase class C family)
MAAVSPAGLQVTNENWQTPPQLAWAFQHVADLFPTAVISRGTGPVAPLAAAAGLAASTTALSQVVVTSPYDGTKSTVEGIIGTTWTDGWIVLHDGVAVAEEYRGGMTPATLHLLMSVSKSLIGCVAGSLVAEGALDVEALVTAYLPELSESGYAGATVRNLLDMRSGIGFSEDYLDQDAEVRVLEEAIGWAPHRRDAVPDGMHAFLKTLRQRGPHGGPFEYRSCETDVLGWVCEAAAGVAMPQLMGDRLWSRLGCELDANIGIDSHADGMFDGGISTSLRDLARFGAMVLRGGASLTGEQVVPESWVADSFAGGADSREAFALSPDDNRMPGGMYRNQFWFPFPDRDVLLCLGIHGQMVYVNPAANVVAAKFSSWPTPQNAVALFGTVAAFDAIADTIAARAG